MHIPSLVLLCAGVDKHPAAFVNTTAVPFTPGYDRGERAELAPLAVRA